MAVWTDVDNKILHIIRPVHIETYKSKGWGKEWSIEEELNGDNVKSNGIRFTQKTLKEVNGKKYILDNEKRRWEIRVYENGKTPFELKARNWEWKPKTAKRQRICKPIFNGVNIRGVNYGQSWLMSGKPTKPRKERVGNLGIVLNNWYESKLKEFGKKCERSGS